MSGTCRPRRDLSGLERPVCAFDLAGELLERDAGTGERLGIRLDPDLLGLFANDVGQADIVQLRDRDPELAGDARQGACVPAVGSLGSRRQGEHDDGDVVDAAPHDQRLRDAVGIRSILARIFSCTRRIAASELVPTRNRAVTITLRPRLE